MNTSPRQNLFVRYCKRLVLWAIIATAIVVPVRAYVITPYRIIGNSVEPELKAGSLAFVYCLTSDFQPGDIVAYRHGENTFVGRCESATPESMKVSRRDEQANIPRQAIIGRVVLSTR
jgi:signal peptidase I